jgi:hypothetical protein
MTWICLGTLQNIEQHKLLNHLSVNLFILSSLLLLNKYSCTVSKSESVQYNSIKMSSLFLWNSWPAHGVVGEVNW